jgi:cis-3-alkyl-4-acyloxetan-2-one decarboxylase
MPASEFAMRHGIAGEYPFESHWLDLDGVRYHYIDEMNEASPGDNQAAAGPLLFVHGNPTWSFAWRNLIKSLSPEFRCIAVDHVGCGLSDKPQQYPYTLEQHIQNLVQLLERLDLWNVTLVGHDWGGCIGMGAASRQPKRFSRFVLMNTAAFRSRRIPRRIAVCRWPILGPLGVRGLNLFCRAALRMAIAPGTQLSEAVRAGFLKPYDSWANRVAVQRFVEDIPLQRDHPSYGTLVEIEESLKGFRDRRFLFVWGMQDWCFTPEFLEEWLERFPEAEVLRLPKASHYVFEDAPEECAGRIRAFLSADVSSAG